MVTKIKSKYTKSVVEKLVMDNSSVASILEKIELNSHGGGHKLITSKIKEYGLDMSHFKRRPTCRRKIPLNEIMVENSSYSRIHLKKRLLKEGIILNVCSICWQCQIWNETLGDGFRPYKLNT